jgi:hypothetical protein
MTDDTSKKMVEILFFASSFRSNYNNKDNDQVEIWTHSLSSLPQTVTELTNQYNLIIYQKTHVIILW